MNRKKPPLKMNNVIVRSISGVVFILAMLACLMFNKFLFAGMIIFVMSVMLLEFYHITMNGSYTFSKILAILAAIFLFGILFAVSSYHIPIRFVAFAMIPVFIVMINSLYVKEKEEYGKFSNIYTGLLYIAVPIALSNLIAFDKASGARMSGRSPSESPWERYSRRNCCLRSLPRRPGSASSEGWSAPSSPPTCFSSSDSFVSH